MTQRRAKNESRSKLLAAGREEFIAARTGSATDVLAHLRLENIAKRAGYSGPGMIYNLWKDPDSETELGITPRELFLRDLLVEVASAPYRNNNVGDTIGQSIAEIADEVDMVRVITNHEFARIVDGLEDSYLPFWSLISGLQVVGVAEALEGVDRVALDELSAIYEIGLAHFGFRMKAPLTIRHLTLSLRALQSGFAETYALHKEELKQLTVPEWLGRSEWTLFGIASWGIIDTMIEPITPERTSAD